MLVIAHPFRFAIQSGPFNDPAALREYAKKVEDLGYSDLFSSDHIGIADPFLPLLVAAEATTTLRFGPLVLNNEFHHPVLVARTAATFDLLTEGRLVLGLGTGYMRSEHDASDITLRPPRDRVTRLGESVDALRSLLDDGATTYEGNHFTLEIQDLGVRPVQPRVPILIGGHGHRLVSMAARKADIFQFTGMTHDPQTGQLTAGGFARNIVAQRHEWVRAAARERYDHLELSTLAQQTKVGAGAAEARTAAATRMKIEPELIDETPFVLIGSVAQVIEKLHGLREEFGIHPLFRATPKTSHPSSKPSPAIESRRMVCG